MRFHLVLLSFLVGSLFLINSSALCMDPENANEKNQVRKVLRTTAPDSVKPFFFLEDMSEERYRAILEALKNGTEDQIYILGQNARSLLRDTMTTEDWGQIINGAFTADAGEIYLRTAVISYHARNTYRGIWRSPGLAKIIAQAIRVNSVELDQRFVTIALRADNYYTMIPDTLFQAKIIAAYLEGTVPQLQAIAGNSHIFFAFDDYGDRRIKLINKLLKHQEREINSLARVVAGRPVVLFPPHLELFENDEIMVNLLAGESAQVQVIARHADVLFTPEMDGFTRSKIIQSALRMSADEIGHRATAIRQNADCFFAPNMTLIECAECVRWLLEQDVAQIQESAQQIRQNTVTDMEF